MADADARTLPVRNPRTGAVDFSLAVSPPEEVAAKAAQLRANQPAWAALRGELAADVRWLVTQLRRIVAAYSPRLRFPGVLPGDLMRR